MRDYTERSSMCSKKCWSHPRTCDMWDWVPGCQWCRVRLRRHRLLLPTRLNKTILKSCGREASAAAGRNPHSGETKNSSTTHNWADQSEGADTLSQNKDGPKTRHRTILTSDLGVMSHLFNLVTITKSIEQMHYMGKSRRNLLNNGITSGTMGAKQKKETPSTKMSGKL